MIRSNCKYFIQFLGDIWRDFKSKTMSKNINQVCEYCN